MSSEQNKTIVRRLLEEPWTGNLKVVDELIDHTQVPLPRFLNEAADNRFVLFRGHTSPFLGAGAPAATLRPEGWDRSCSEEGFGTRGVRAQRSR